MIYENPIIFKTLLRSDRREKYYYEKQNCERGLLLFSSLFHLKVQLCQKLGLWKNSFFMISRFKIIFSTSLLFPILKIKNKIFKYSYLKTK